MANLSQRHGALLGYVVFGDVRGDACFLESLDGMDLAARAS